MTSALLNDLPPLDLLSFFSYEIAIPHLPSLDLSKPRARKLLQCAQLVAPPFFKAAFAKLYMGWNLEGFYALVDVRAPFRESHFAKIEEGDSIEIFINTRVDVPSGGLSRFCHHFAFLPQEETGREMTRLRMEEKRDLCDSASLLSISHFESKTYTTLIHIPFCSLYGFALDRSSFGLAYRINRTGKESQNFPLPPSYHRMAYYPNFWGTIVMKPKESE